MSDASTPTEYVHARDLAIGVDVFRIDIEIDQWSREPFHVYELRDATIVGSAYPVCLLERPERNLVLFESSDYDPWAQQWSMTALAEPGAGIVVGEIEEACCLSLPHNYCHWHQETLPKVCIMERMGFTGQYVVADVPLFLESLKLVGIDPSRIHTPSEGRLQVARLFVPEQLALFHGSRFPMALWEARTKCLEKADLSIVSSRLYIGRAGSTHRRVVGDEAFTSYLASLGFKKVLMEQLSLPQQIGLASSASVIIGPHGAGISNCLFMREGGHLLEMFSPSYINCCVLPVCRLLNISYNPVVSQVNPVGSYEDGENIKPDMELIRYFLDRALT